jgi:Glycosyl hydrolase catalytic core/Ricin-type beta-trefoil lectin domain-like/Cadherin domain/F5/8 type C domain
MKYAVRKPSFEFLEPRRLFATVNMAKFQSITADSNVNADSVASFAVDGIVSNDYRWISDNTGPHWLEINLSAPYAIGSAHVYLGTDNGATVGSFSIQYFSGGNWVNAASVTNNTATELKLPFSSVVSGVTRFRFYTTAATARVKEIVLLTPGDFPLGTGVNLNLASHRTAVGSSVSGAANYAINTVDGYVDDNSRWLANSTAGPHSIELNLSNSQTASATSTKTSHLVGSLHLYSGVLSSGNVISPLASFSVEYANRDSGWLPIAGGTVSSGSMVGNLVSNNTSPSLVVNFATPVTATAMRVNFTEPFGRIRELVVLHATNRADGAVGYPIGTSVEFAPKPSTLFERYGDSFFRINSRVNSNSLVSTANSSSLISSTTVTQASQYQLLYSYALDAYRLRNRDTGLAIEVAGASTVSGAAIVEGEYSASPHQLWRLIPTDTGYFQIVNVWSGMALDVDISGASPVVTQKARDTSTTPADRQEWTTSLVAKNIKKGTGGYVGQFGANWAYNWGPTTTAENDPAVIDKDFQFSPMQWGAYEAWMNRANKLYGDWQNNVKPQFFLGFNEPDKTDQSNVTVERAVEAWPQLVSADVPLLSPATADGAMGDAWLESFSDQVDALGYRVDYTGMHWYSTPNVNGVLDSIDDIQTKGNGRNVWLTEFSVVDWSNGSGDFSEETNYNFILELLWRLETKANLEKYAIFVFTGDSPTNPWDLANPRSNFRSSDGTLTPFGKAYTTWDNDTAIRNNTPYVLHNRAASHRVANLGGSSFNASTIRVEDATVQWQLRDAGSGKKYIESGVDGRLLRYNGTTLDFAPAGTIGTAVEWTIAQEQYGWRNIIHPQTGRYLQLNRTNNASNAPTALNFTMVTAAAATTTASNWWFAKPYAPISDVGPVTDSSPAANQVNENSPVGTIVGITANAADPDAGQTVTYSLTDNAVGRFAIHPTTGVVTVAGALDYETTTSHSITIQATSTDSTTSSVTFAINVLNVSDASITNRRVFYNRTTSAVFGNGTGNPINAIDSSKAALLPGEAATTANYTNYSRGLNGLIIDLTSPTNLSAISPASFQFASWSNFQDSVPNFLTINPAVTISTIAGGGLNGSDRVKLEFANNAIQNAWLRVTMLADASTGLASNDVFYFGNARFDVTPTSPFPSQQVIINAFDVNGIRLRQGQTLGGISSIYDVDRSGVVNAFDTNAVRTGQGVASLRFFTAPSALNLGLAMIDGNSSALSFDLRYTDAAFADLSLLETSQGDYVKNRRSKRV